MSPNTSRDATGPTTRHADADTAGTEDRVIVLVLTYTAPPAAVDAVLPAHRRFLDEHFASGEFLASGPREPRTGGVILARVPDQSRIAELVAADPFTRSGLATYEVVVFNPTRGPFALPLRQAGAPARPGRNLSDHHEEPPDDALYGYR